MCICGCGMLWGVSTCECGCGVSRVFAAKQFSVLSPSPPWLCCCTAVLLCCCAALTLASLLRLVLV